MEVELDIVELVMLPNEMVVLANCFVSHNFPLVFSSNLPAVAEMLVPAELAVATKVVLSKLMLSTMKKPRSSSGSHSPR